MVLVEDALNVNIKQIRAIKLVIMINTIRETLKKSDFFVTFSIKRPPPSPLIILFFLLQLNETDFTLVPFFTKTI